MLPGRLRVEHPLCAVMPIKDNVNALNGFVLLRGDTIVRSVLYDHCQRGIGASHPQRTHASSWVTAAAGDFCGCPRLVLDIQDNCIVWRSLRTAQLCSQPCLQLHVIPLTLMG